MTGGGCGSWLPPTGPEHGGGLGCGLPLDVNSGEMKMDEDRSSLDRAAALAGEEERSGVAGVGTPLSMTGGGGGGWPPPEEQGDDGGLVNGSFQGEYGSSCLMAGVRSSCDASVISPVEAPAGDGEGCPKLGALIRSGKIGSVAGLENGMNGSCIGFLNGNDNGFFNSCISSVPGTVLHGTIATPAIDPQLGASFPGELLGSAVVRREADVRMEEEPGTIMHGTVAVQEALFLKMGGDGRLLDDSGVLAMEDDEEVGGLARCSGRMHSSPATMNAVGMDMQMEGLMDSSVAVLENDPLDRCVQRQVLGEAEAALGSFSSTDFCMGSSYGRPSTSVDHGASEINGYGIGGISLGANISARPGGARGNGVRACPQRVCGNDQRKNFFIKEMGVGHDASLPG